MRAGPQGPNGPSSSAMSAARAAAQQEVVWRDVTLASSHLRGRRGGWWVSWVRVGTGKWDVGGGPAVDGDVSSCPLVVLDRMAEAGAQPMVLTSPLRQTGPSSPHCTPGPSGAEQPLELRQQTGCSGWTPAAL